MSNINSETSFLYQLFKENLDFIVLKLAMQGYLFVYYISIYACTCMCLCIYVSIYVYMYVCMYVWKKNLSWTWVFVWLARAQANIYHLSDCKPSTTEINVVCKLQATSRCLPPARVAIEHLATAVVAGHLMGCVRLATPATFTTHQY